MGLCRCLVASCMHVYWAGICNMDNLSLAWVGVPWRIGECFGISQCLENGRRVCFTSGLSSDVVVVWHSSSALVSIDEVNLHRARLVLGWSTMSGFISHCRTLILLCKQPPKANSAFHPYGVGKWGSASAGKAKAGMVHSVSGWTLGVQVKLWDPLRTRVILERLRRVFTTRCCTNPRLPYLTLYYTILCL